jgi:formylglycine-generating enzyme required for sulfatase activity
MAPAQLWLASESDNDFPIELRARRFNRMLLSDAAGGNPSEQHPMQQISAQAALWFAGLCGCRLPTSQEWAAAYQLYEKKGTPDQWNLRDRTWELQRGYVSAAFAALQPAQWPDEGIFRPEGLPLPTGRDARSRSDSDGTLFFRPVALSGGSVFHHLVGNVAEYLCDAPEQFDGLKDKRSPQSVRSFAEQAAQNLAVIGGSALAPPEVPVDKPLPLTHPDQGYADVGFRLAFTAPAKSLSEQVKWALQGQSYLWPAAANH